MKSLKKTLHDSYTSFHCAVVISKTETTTAWERGQKEQRMFEYIYVKIAIACALFAVASVISLAYKTKRK